MRWIFLYSAVAFAQKTTSTTLSVIPHQGDGPNLEIRNMPAGTQLPAAWFQNEDSPGRDTKRYKIFQISNPGTSLARPQEVTSQYVDSSKPVQVLGNIDAVIPLKQSLHSDQTYLVEATDKAGNMLDISVTSAPSLAGGFDQKHLRDRLVVNASVPLQTSYPAGTVSVTYDPGNGQPVPFQVSSVTVNPSQGLVLQLAGELPAGLANPLQIMVIGINDTYGVAVQVSGPVPSAPSAPTDTTKDFMSVALSAIAAVHSAPTFSATGTFAPVHTATNTVIVKKWGTNELHFDPSVVFDVGSANASTTNSVTVPSEFVFPKLLGLPKPPQGQPGKLPDLPTKQAHVTVMNYLGGLRAEVDTQYLGLNLMGEGRIEWYLSSLFRTASSYQAKVTAMNPAIRSTVNLPTNGFSITPYVQYDGGSHVTHETITNTSAGQPAVNIPTFSISRLYLGFQVTGQLGRQGVNLDGSWVKLFVPETAPFTQNTFVATRTVSGFQPHAKGTYTYAFDQEKHFSGSVAWENGRSAPAFTYLNKVTVGIQVTY